MAARKVKVYNDNAQVPKWKETFKGEELIIEYGKPIEMDFFDAHEFKGQFFPMRLLGDDKTQDPRTMKMIRVEAVDLNALNKEVEKTMGFTCNACKKSYANVKLLTKHSELEHAELVVVDEEIEAEIKLEHKKRGRPAKTNAVQTVE